MAYKDKVSLLGHVRELKWDDVKGFVKLGLAFIPGKLMRMRHKDVWVVSEYPENARDNGYWFFRYMRLNHPDQPVYYPIRKNASDYPKVAPLGNTVEFGSLRHFALFWAASAYMTTTKQHGFPHERIGILFVVNNWNKFNYVFLNHGVARGYSSIVDGRDTNYSMIVAISEAEKQAIVNLNYQPEEIVQPIGFCRHDSLNDELLDKKLILFMPTWRMWLDYRHEDDPQKIEEIKQAFEDSAYRARIQEFLASPRLARFLEQNDLRMLVYLHGYAQMYTDAFQTGSDRIIMEHKEDAFIQDLLKRAAYLVTDYSSVIYDFAYMKKPCCYYQFDAEEFAAKQYAESEYFTYERDGFGPVFTELDEVLDDIEQAHAAGFAMNEKYRSRVENYFPSFGTDHCETTYRLVNELPPR